MNVTISDEVTKAVPQRRPKKKVLEKDIQREICDWLFSFGVFFWRNNTIPVFDRAKSRFRALPKYTPRGLPDVMILYKGIFIGMEVKVPHYWKRTDAQMDIHEKMSSNGGHYHIVTSLAEAQAIMVQHGVDNV